MIELFGMQILRPWVFTVVTTVATLMSVGSLYIHRKIVDPKRMAEIRKKIEEHQREYTEAQKANDKKKVKELEDEQEKIMELVKENMYASFKPMIITTPIVLGVLWVFGVWYGPLGPIVSMPFGIPFITKAFKAARIANGMDWLGLYILWALIVSLVVQMIIKYIDKGGDKK